MHVVSNCLIWGEMYSASGVYYPETDMYLVSKSPRAGNGYRIHRTLLSSSISALSPDERMRLSSWLVGQRIQGVAIPEITESILDYVKRARMLHVHERADRLLKHLAERSTTVGQVVEIGTEGERDSFGGWVQGKSPTTWATMAWSESSNWEEIRFFLNYLEEQGFVGAGNTIGGMAMVNVKIKGYSHIAEVSASRDLSQAFVAMWFSKDMTEHYENGIKPAIEQSGYKAMNIGEKPDVDKIDDEIIAEIRRSRFLVADFTHGANGARGGVYYEAGFAHGLGIPVIRSCRKDIIDRNELHFDVRQYYHVPWETSEELRDGLAARIRALIGEGPELIHP